MKIAIQGHPTRGKEVIQILENLGGINSIPLEGDNRYVYYGIYENEIMVLSNFAKYKRYTLEEFEKEFPFKIGDRVISKTTDFIGTIIRLKENGYYYVKYDNGNIACPCGQNLKLYKEMKEERNITLTLDKAREWYKKGGELREIALQAFNERELNPHPRSWEEFVTNHPRMGYYISSDGKPLMCAASGKLSSPHVCPSEKSAEAHLAMIQLEQLRNCWRQGWEPDWNDAKQAKCYICYYQGKFKISTFYETRCFLSFPTTKMAREFLECFRELIEKAGDLI